MKQNPPPFAPITASRPSRLPAMLLAFILPCAAVPPALAGDPGPNAAQKETARGLMDLGDAKIEAGDYAAALHAYQGADAIMGVPTTGLAVARANVGLGKLVEAADALGRVRRYPERADEPAAFASARRAAHTLYAEVIPRIPVVRVVVRGVAPDRASVLLIDGAELTGDSVDQPHRVNPGRHVIAASAEGYTSDQKTITLAEGQRYELTLELVVDPDAKPVVPDPANLPDQPKATPAPGAEPDITISPLTYSAFAIGGASALLGTITGIASLAMTSDLEAQCVDRVCSPALESDHDTVIALANVSNVALALGAVGAGVGVVSLIFDLDDDGGADATARVSVEPLVGLGFVGLKGAF